LLTTLGIRPWEDCRLDAVFRSQPEPGSETIQENEATGQTFLATPICERPQFELGGPGAYKNQIVTLR